MHRAIRRASNFNTERIDQIYEDPHAAHRRLFLHYGDLTENIVTVRNHPRAWTTHRRDTRPGKRP